MNQVTLTGTLGNDPTVKTFGDNKTVMNNSIRWSEKVGEKWINHYFNFTAFNGCAQFVLKHFSKGKPIEIHGKLQTDTWEKDGAKRTNVYVLVDNVSFVPKEYEAKSDDIF